MNSIKNIIIESSGQWNYLPSDNIYYIFPIIAFIIIIV